MRHVSKLPSVQLQRRLRIVLSQPLRSELWRIAWRRVTSVLPPSGFERSWMLRINERPRPARRRHTVRVDHVRVRRVPVRAVLEWQASVVPVV